MTLDDLELQVMSWSLETSADSMKRGMGGAVGIL